MGIFSRKPKVLVRVHIGYFQNPMELNGEPYYFINVLNIDKNKNIIITDVLCKHYLTIRSIQQLTRPLPIKVTPGEQWETWVRLEDIGEEAFESFYVYFNSTNRNNDGMRSIKRINVPSSGTVPGDS